MGTVQSGERFGSYQTSCLQNTIQNLHQGYSHFRYGAMSAAVAPFLSIPFFSRMERYDDDSRNYSDGPEVKKIRRNKKKEEENIGSIGEASVEEKQRTDLENTIFQ